MKDNKIVALITAGIAFLCVIAVGTVITMHASGLEIFRQEKVATSAPKAPTTVSTQWKVSPASNTLQKTLNTAPKGWENQGNQLESPQAPYPFSCATEGINPAISYAQNYKAKGRTIQVLTSAYTAGLAETGLNDKINRATSCGGGTYSIYGLSQFTNGHQVNVSTGVQKTKTIIFRHGDVVTYVIGDSNNGNMITLAKEFEEHLSKNMQKVCANPNYTGDETTRTVFSHDDYKGYYTPAKVTIPKVELPEIPEDENYKTVKIGAKTTPVKDVTLPTKPTQYPVWPELPTSVNKPTEPELPATKANTEKGYQSRTEDKVGPGCGWAFTGSTAPEYDEADANNENKMTKQTTEEELVRDAQKWQQSVLDYYKDYDQYEQDAPKWNDYVEEVNTVTQAWNKIRGEWETYWANHAQWEQEVQARDAFIAQQKQAQNNYDTAIQTCQNWESGQAERDKKLQEYQKALQEYRNSENDLKAEWDKAEQDKVDESKKEYEKYMKDNNDNSDETKDKEQAPEIYKAKPYKTENTPPAKYTPPAEPQCPPTRPAILDQAPPTVSAEPEEPADPRPASERN